ncbi:mitogen-activated protein kinase kinase kinase 18-like [Cynara cardunculus var. scolymus]|uniref:Protein kinase, ATP binding site-containing protein n=1 Tax=Cynara cardunculus var. scolymus TaxID=59895 RepID=A0A103XE04_CYNCS|nr:mitogen-activated protein kinase kinase kinase 18-like [Cynara cardunculus var. scolymus]KVH88985.1 Protein kinase, ATP binding site-containing protein [Cynara cardunculus var. scolymus]
MEWTRGSVLGRGSSATVSTATSTSTSGEVFAVKSVALSQSESLQKENHFLSILKSSRVVGYKGCEISREDGKMVYNIFMQFMAGGSIIDLLNRSNGGGLTNLEIQRYTKHIVEGLDYLHSNGVVHCDIKGRNVLIDESGAKIGDLGCAKWVDDDQVASPPICGTPMFMAPEVARGEEQGFPADIWALGCTVIEMATGGSPWPNANDPVSVLYRIGFSGEIPEIPDGFSNQAKDFVRKCLIRDPKQRWTAKQLLKHPFIGEFDDHPKEIICEKMISTDSPTSILDQDVWNSMEESLSLSLSLGSSVDCEFPQSTCSLRQRIKQLADKSEIPKWRCEKGESDWMTIRRNEDGDGKAMVGRWQVR